MERLPVCLLFAFLSPLSVFCQSGLVGFQQHVLFSLWGSFLVLVSLHPWTPLRCDWGKGCKKSTTTKIPAPIGMFMASFGQFFLGCDNPFAVPYEACSSEWVAFYYYYYEYMTISFTAHILLAYAITHMVIPPNATRPSNRLHMSRYSRSIYRCVTIGSW